MSDKGYRPLHLHTIESICIDLVSGRSIGVGPENTPFRLSGNASRSILDWYRRNRDRWASDVRAADAEALVRASSNLPPILPSAATRPEPRSKRRLRLARIEAYRFAGLHAYGSLEHPPPTFVHEFNPQLTLFEGLNGSGKTSLLNAIIWCLTGQILRPQRLPEDGTIEFTCQFNPTTSGDPTYHRITPVTPLPDASLYRPDDDWVTADTWVELTFVDQEGASLPPLRRSQYRTARGRLNETPPDIGALGIDPIAIDIGTLMPGPLPFIQVGSESELGRVT